MTDWLTRFIAEIDAVTTEDNAEPEQRTEPSEHVVGIAPPRLRKIWFLAKHYEHKANEAFTAAESLQSEALHEKITEASFYDKQSDVLNDMFWLSCHDEFPQLKPHVVIGVRKGWEVVWMELPILEDMRSALGGSSRGIIVCLGGDHDDEEDGPKPGKGTTLH